MNPSAASSNNNQEGLVNKLQGALSKFRNERDQLHRSKELALEKCLLVQQEADALQTSVSSMKDKFTMKRKVSETLKKELGPLEETVQAESKQVSIYGVLYY
jgi:chromosome segregation ATPase